jgi:hypothetical protein
MAINTTTTLHLRSSAPSRLPRSLARQLVTMFKWFSRRRRQHAADKTPASNPRPPPPTLHHASIDGNTRSHADEDDTIETEPVHEWRLHHSRQLTPAAAYQHRRARRPDHKPDPRASSKPSRPSSQRASSPSRLARTHCKHWKKRRKRHLVPRSSPFLSAVHRIMAPRSISFAQYPQDDLDNGPLEQLSAMPPWFRDITPGDPEYLDECTLPELHNQDTLPLAYWHAPALPWCRLRRTQTSLQTTGARASIENTPRGMADSLVTKPPRRR